MGNKYGIYQSSKTSCIFYKEDDDGKQSTFNLFVSTDSKIKEKKSISAFIDNEHIDKENWFAEKDMPINEAINAFNKWASDAPVLFEMEAHKSLSRCIDSMMKME